MDKPPVRVIIVDDYEPWRRFFSTSLQKQPELQIIGEVSDGLVAVQKAKERQPELILLDIGLPTLNGIEAARQIRKLSPTSKILFVSENRSADIAREALSTGASGYVVKSDAASELLIAVNAVLKGERFVSASLRGLNGPPDPQTGARFQRDNITTLIPTQNVGSAHQHEVGFYSDDRHFLNDVTRFIEAALRAGNAAIVVATGSHRESLLLELRAVGLDMDAAIEEGRHIPLDADDALSMFMVNGMLDPVRFLDQFGDLIVTATEAAKGANPRVSIFGEGVHLLWAKGEIFFADIFWAGLESAMESDVYQRICTEHSAVYSR